MTNKLIFPIAVSELQEYLPHREPMVWINQINHADSDGGECLVLLNPQAHYMDGEKVRRTSVIEWIAQAYGFVSACHKIENEGENYKGANSKAYLVSIKNILFSDNFDQLLNKENSLLVYVKTLGNLNHLKSIYGKIRTLSGKQIAAGEIKVFSEG